MEKRDLTIRRLGADDAQAVLDYMKIIGGQSHNLTFGAEGLPFHIQAEAQFLDRYAKHPTNAQWGVWDQTELVAVASFDAQERKRMAHRGEIALSVRKDHWHCGIGTLLMETMFAHAHTIPSLNMLTLTVITDNTRAIALYERFGFVICGCWHRFFCVDGTYDDAYSMECDLNTQKNP